MAAAARARPRRRPARLIAALERLEAAERCSHAEFARRLELMPVVWAQVRAGKVGLPARVVSLVLRECPELWPEYQADVESAR